MSEKNSDTQTIQADVIQCKRFQVVNDDGRVVCEIGANEHGYNRSDHD